MNNIGRREFVRQAAVFGAALMWATRGARASSIGWQERRDLFPQGVASGDPDHESVILWTRRPADGKIRMTVEVATDPEFANIAARGRMSVAAETD